MSEPSFDVTAAHRHFSGACFNACWGLIDLAERTPEQEEEMIRLAVASHHHWTQRDDCGAKETSVANWQLSRVFARVGEVSLAVRYGQRSLAAGQQEGVGPFYVAYAHEALARAAAVAGDTEARDHHAAEARAALEGVEAETAGWVEKDLATLP